MGFFSDVLADAGCAHAEPPREARTDAFSLEVEELGIPDGDGIHANEAAPAPLAASPLRAARSPGVVESRAPLAAPLEPAGREAPLRTEAHSSSAQSSMRDEPLPVEPLRAARELARSVAEPRPAADRLRPSLPAERQTTLAPERAAPARDVLRTALGERIASAETWSPSAGEEPTRAPEARVRPEVDEVPLPPTQGPSPRRAQPAPLIEVPLPLAQRPSPRGEEGSPRADLPLPRAIVSKPDPPRAAPEPAAKPARDIAAPPRSDWPQSIARDRSPPAPAAPPEPRVHIGRIEVMVVTREAPPGERAPEAPRADVASRRYLRSL